MRHQHRPPPQARVTFGRVWLDGVYVRISTIRPSSRRSFVRIPGMGVSATYFERLAAHLSEHRPVHSLDLPGFGGVPHPDQRMTISQYADLVERAIATLGLDDPIVVAHSMGTEIAADLAARRPDLTQPDTDRTRGERFERTVPRQA